jgi:hypothetical protein
MKLLKLQLLLFSSLVPASVLVTDILLSILLLICNISVLN